MCHESLGVVTEIRVSKDPGSEALHKRAGRKLQYSTQQLMNVWVFVKTGIVREKSNAHKFCTKKRSIYWVDGGLPRSKKLAAKMLERSRISHRANGRTLWRRYQEAEAFLEREAKKNRKLWEYAGRQGEYVRQSSTEDWWRREVDLTLARLK